MSSIEYFTNGFVSMMWDSTFTPDLYEKNFCFYWIKSRNPRTFGKPAREKKKVGWFYSDLLRGCKNEPIIGNIFRKFRRRCEILNKFSKSVFDKGINEIKKILVEDGDIAEMLELVFSNEKHYNNILKFLNGQI